MVIKVSGIHLLVCLVLAAAVVSVSSAESTASDEAMQTLLQVRGELRDRLRGKAAADAAVEPPRDVQLTVDQGLGRGSMQIVLRRAGGRWLLLDLEQGRRPVDIERIDASKLAWEGNRIAGEIRFVLRESDDGEAAPADDEAAADDEGTDASGGELGEPAKVQVYALDLKVEEVEPRLVLRLHRFQGGSDWVLAYQRKGDAWVFEKELVAPSQLQGWGPFERTYPTLTPDGEGRIEGELKLTYKGDQPRLGDAYAATQPRVRFAGRLIDGRIDTMWLLQAPGGKHLLGSGQDMLTGAIRTAVIEGRYRSTGARGRWMGEASGAVMPAPSDPVAFAAAEDRQEPPTDPAEATQYAAEVYREIRALDLALRGYPMPLTDAMVRTFVPEPVWEKGVTNEAMHRYIEGLAKQAGMIGAGEESVAEGFLTTGDPAFGPYFGKLCLTKPREPNRIGKTVAGPQQWRSLTGWQMIGPFGLFSQTTPVRHPELLPVAGASYRRSRVFSDAEGNVETLRDEAKWMPARLDGATVTAPHERDAFSGSERFIAWYAYTDIESEVEQVVWLSMQLQGQAVVWLNEQPVWRSGVDYEALGPAVFQVKLGKGSNRLMVRCANNRASDRLDDRVDWFDGYPDRPVGRVELTHFAVHVCTQGGPGAGEGGSEAVAGVGADQERYRRDGSGVYEAEDPPLAWDLEKGTNVAWQIELPPGTAEPVVRGGRVYLTAEPDLIMCIDAQEGKELWRQAIDPPADSPKRDGYRRKAEPREATASPVVTDDRLYVHFGAGVVACLGLDGERKWVKGTGAPWDHPNMGSPWLIDGKLVIQAHLPGDKTGQFGLIALDAATGDRLWEATAGAKRVVSEHDRATGLGNGLAVMRLRNGQKQKTLFITGDGVVIDASNGELLHRDIFGLEAIRTPPYVDGDVVYTAPVTGQEAVKLWLDDQGRVGARTLWRMPPKWGRGQAKTTTDFGTKHWMKGPVLKDDMLYVVRVDGAHVPQHYVCPWTQLDIYDVKSGTHVSRLRAVLREATDPTVAPAIAGRYLYVADGGAPVGGFGGTTEYGQMAVLEIMPRTSGLMWMHTPTHNGFYGVVCLAARNQIGRTRCAPVFEDSRMYLRSFDGLACIAVESEKGREYQQMAVARTTVRELVGREPQPVVAKTIPALPEPPGEVRPVTALRVGAAGKDWTLLGPMDASVADAVREKLAAGQAQPTAGEDLAVDGAKLTFRRVGPEHYTESGALDAVSALDGNRNCTGYFYTVLECGRKQRLRYDPNAVVARTWLGGQAIEAGDILDLDFGYYPMLIEVRTSLVPAWVEAPKLTLGFGSATRVDDRPELWRERVRVLQPRLERIIRELPGTSEARTARVSLQDAGLVLPEDIAKPKPRPVAEAGNVPTQQQRKVGPATEEDGSDAMLVLIAGAACVLAVVIGVVVVLRRRAGRSA